MNPLSRRRLARHGLAVVGLAMATGCGVTTASRPTPSKIPRIGYLGVSGVDRLDGLRRGLREFGYVEGESIAIEYRFTDGRISDAPALAAELVKLNVPVIVTQGNEATAAAKGATNVIPIVMTVGDPIPGGLVTNLARPEGNLTGLSTSGMQTTGKRLQLLKEAFPNSQQVAVLLRPNNPSKVMELGEAQTAARQLGLTLQPFELRPDTNLDDLFQAVSRSGVHAMLVLTDSQVAVHRFRLADFAVQQRLPAIYEDRQYTDAGGLMSYGIAVPELYYQSAKYVDKLLKGAKPADLPIELPTTFHFIINLKAAQTAGFTIPRSVLAQATEVIQ